MKALTYWRVKVQANNLSRRDFGQFIKDTGLERDGNRNVCICFGKKFVWCPSDTGDIRQFYEDCAGAIINDKFVSKDKFKFGNVTRITNTGLKAYQANLKVINDQ